MRFIKSQGVHTSSGGAKMPKILKNLKNPQNFNAFHLFSSVSGGVEGAKVQPFTPLAPDVSIELLKDPRRVSVMDLKSDDWI